MIKLLLHIGSTKTGSSALQGFLNKNAKELKKNGVIYPQVGVSSNAHHLIAALLHPNAAKLHEEELQGQNLEKFSQTIKKHIDGAENVVISSEYFWSTTDLYKKRTVKYFRALGFESIEIMVYVREFFDWVQSQYSQSVRSGNSDSFLKWVEKNMKRSYTYFNYLDNLNQWVNAGVNKVNVYPYPIRSNSGDVRIDFLNRISVNPQDFKYNNRYANQSMGTYEVETLALLNGLNLSFKQKEKIKSLLLGSDNSKPSYPIFQHLNKESFDLLNNALRQDFESFIVKYPMDKEFCVYNAESKIVSQEQKHRGQISTLIYLLAINL